MVDQDTPSYCGLCMTHNGTLVSLITTGTARFVFVHLHTKVGQVCWYVMFKHFHRVEYAQQKRKPRKLLQTTKLVWHGDAVRPGVFVFMYMHTKVHQVCYG